MKLKTSFFNTTVLKKDITRFAPVWGIYSVILLLVYLIGCMGNKGYPEHMLNDLYAYFTSFSIINLIYAWICAMAVFGDLYKSRVCNALHAMPIRRESWFLSHVVAALLFCAVPNTLFAVCISPILGQYWYLAFLWLAVCLMQFITMFGIAAFMAMCTGTRLGLFITYVAANYWPLLVSSFVDLFYSSVTNGVQLDMDLLNKLYPMRYYSSMDYIGVERNYDYIATRYIYHGMIGSDILTTALLALAGVALLIGALLLYRRRKLETAGDFMANRPSAVVFHVLFSMFVGWVFCGIGSELPKNGGIVIGFLGITVGFFTGQMLLQRKVNVFGKKNLVVWALVMAFMAVSVLLTALDPLRLAEKPPKQERIKSVSIYNVPSDDSDLDYYTGIADADLYPVLLAWNLEDVEPVLRMHQKLIEEKPEKDTRFNVTFHYELTDGRTLKYTYPVSDDYLNRSVVRDYYSNWENLFATSDWETYSGSVVEILVHPGDSDKTSLLITDDLSGDDAYRKTRKVPMDENSKENVLLLLETMKEECKNGLITPDYFEFLFRFRSGDYSVTIKTVEDGQEVTRKLMVNEDCTDTIALIEKLMEIYYAN